MGTAMARRRKTRSRMKAGAVLLALAAWTAPVSAQFDREDFRRDAQMLLIADTLVYDQDQNTVSAVGGVQIEYGGNRLVAQRVTYHRDTSRVVASGRVEIIEEDGNRISADRIDVTDDFREGFVQALRVETVDETYFAAENAERTAGRLTTFNRAVYTACEPCEEKPDSPPLWQIKAKKVIWDGQAKTVRFENARFEMFGLPLAWLPFLEIADPTVKRKTGLLAPSIRGGGELGVGVKVPYYLALAPTYDLTLAVTGYTKQGFLGEAEWRQQFNNGAYNLRIAGIQQNSPEEWSRGRVDRFETERGMIASKGEFDINPRWKFGWDAMAQSDKNFARTYGIEGYSSSVHTDQVYLTGLHDRNYFDLHAYRFQVQESVLDSSDAARNDKQPVVLPVLDYSYTPDATIGGGELDLDVNIQSLSRKEGMYGSKLQGLEGNSGRLTAEAEWRRSFVTSAGLIITPILHARGDAIYADLSAEAIDEIQTFTSGIGDIRSSYYRSMATVGLESRWPILFSTSSSAHVLEPVAQIFVRPDEPFHNRLGIPNEDAQSLVFDATTLFERDKFSGYDRIEGGTRANLGVRYTGSFAGGWTAHGIFGQSYHLAGENSYASQDLVNVGANSGLETDVSDFVGLFGVVSPGGLAISAAGRFDEKTFELRRAELRAAGSTGPLTASVQYAFIESQPEYGYEKDRQEIRAQASLRFNENWRGFASGTYDLEDELLVRNNFGFAYDDECFTYVMTFSQTRTSNETTQRFGINISLRTLGDFGTDTGAALFSR